MMTNRNNSEQERLHRSDLSNDEYETTAPSTDYRDDHSPDYDPNYNSEIEPDTVSTRPPTPDEIAYHNGYVNGQQRKIIHEDIQRTQAENSAATGAIVGLIIASVAGAILAGLYFTTQERQPQVAPAPTASPVQPQASPAQPQNNRTTVIERIREVPSAPQNTEVIVTPTAPASQSQPSITQPSVTQPDGTQPSLTQPNLTQPVPSPLPSEQTSPNTTVQPVDPAFSDPNQSLSQPDATSNGTGTIGQ